MLFLRKQLYSLFFLYILLIFLALASDYLLHLSNLAWISRYMGIGGTIFILLSFIYSLKKRNRGFVENAGFWLRWHEIFGWIGALLILIHGGIHFNMLLPWISLVAMLVVVGSGFVGRYLLVQYRKDMNEALAAILPGRVSSNTKTVLKDNQKIIDNISNWRRIHIPLTITFGSLALIHIFSILMLWTWK